MTLRRSSISVLALFGYLFTGGLFGTAARVLCIKPGGHAAVELDCARCCQPEPEPRPGCGKCGEHGCPETEPEPAIQLGASGCCDCLDVPVFHEPHLTTAFDTVDSEPVIAIAAAIPDIPVSFRTFDLASPLASDLDRTTPAAPPLRAEILRC